MYDKSKITIDKRINTFVNNVFKVLKSMKLDIYNRNAIEQLLKSSSSIGANYYEATTAASAKDFANKLTIARKEAAESKYWLDLLMNIEESSSEQLRVLSNESHEILLICGAIVRNTKLNASKNKNN